jgi:TPR repeat protein
MHQAGITGIGVEEDSQQAAAWYRKAAEQGNAQTQRYLGIRYATGDGVERDPNQAAKWFQKAARQDTWGHPAEARSHLMKIYEEIKRGMQSAEMQCGEAG